MGHGFARILLVYLKFRTTGYPAFYLVIIHLVSFLKGSPHLPRGALRGFLYL